jgi:hypothetical protein
LVAPTLWGNFEDGSFWEVFAVFFPAVTGVLAGVNLSGTLAKPRRSIPRGTMLAIIVSYMVYMSLAYWTSRVATPQELISNFTIMIDKAAFGWVIQAGILAATFSAALNSLVGSPRVLQAMAQHDVVPFGKTFAKETALGEPRNALYLTGGIGVATLVFGLLGGGLNGIAPLMTMFFLITYAVLNAVVLLEQSLKLTSFRPTFRIRRIIPTIGLIGSFVAMLLINPIFSLVAIGIIIALYEFLSLRRLVAPWSDVRSGMFVSFAEWAAKRVLSLPSGQDRAWKPALLVPVQSVTALRHSYRFLEAITKPNGTLHVLGCYEDGQREEMQGLLAFQESFAGDGVFARVALVQARRFRYTLQTAMEVFTSAFFRPNTLFFPIEPAISEEKLQFILDHATENNMGAILYFDNLETLLGREQVINVWIREQSPTWEVGLRLSNLDLALLLAYHLAQNWHGQINLITVVKDESEWENGKLFLDQLIELGRMPRHTKAIVEVGTFDSYLPNAPQADLNMFGLLGTINLEAMNKLSQLTASSCVFVRDSGSESALA